MLFRASSEMEGQPADLGILRSRGAEAGGDARFGRDGGDQRAPEPPGGRDEALGPEAGLPAGADLVELASAVVFQDAARVAAVRARLVATLGPVALVDAAAVVGNFMRMNRIADATGIPLDGPMNALSADIQDELDLSAFQSAANSRPPGWLAARLGPAVRVWTARVLGRSRAGRS